MAIAKYFSLQGQSALVTGGGNGIGKAICLMFAELGADVACTDRNLDDAELVANECRSFGVNALAAKCDVTIEDDLEQVVSLAMSRFGKISILVNNAGGGGPKPFDMPMSDFEWAFQLNLFSAFRMCQLCAKPMRDLGGGAIINITSMAGQNKNQRMCSYGSSKAALDHLTRNMAFDLGPDNIRVNAIAPGAIRTAALESVLTPDIEKAMLKHTPLGRLGDGTDIAAAAAFLASPASAWISGQVLTVSGGGVQELD
jgi:7-alpha-hydroxysteroid dehydrogenase